MNIKKNLALKTSIILTIVLSTAAFLYSVFIYNKQMNNINNIIQHEKNYILNQLKEKENQILKKEKNELLNSIDLLSNYMKEDMLTSNFHLAKKTIIEFMNLKPTVKAIVVKDSIIEKPFVLAYRKNGKIIFAKKLPDNIKYKYNFISFKIYCCDREMATIKTYYDEKIIEEKVRKQQQEQLEKLKETQKILIQNAKENLNHTIIIFVIMIILINIIIFILMIKFISNPIKDLKRLLDSFFRFLKDPNEKIAEIQYQSSDEIGEIIEEVNENIKVSEKLHKDIANLVRTVDKNVAIINIDKDGIIKSVSKAFSELTGYSKDELVGKNFKVLLEDEEEKIEKAWDTIKHYNFLKDEFKIKTKKGNIIYLNILITTKCDQDICGFNAIAFDITDKKKVEELLLTLEEKVEERTKELRNAKQEIENLLSRLKSSIDFASFIQHAILTKEDLFKEAFKDYFIIYKPKDVVGGDIYQFIKISEDKYVLMLMDCTSHGVAGAFVTMLVKAITEQTILNLKEGILEESPAAILNFFNSAIKQILNQYEDSDTKSNVGFDGAILCYNKKEKKITFTGAQIPLFYVKNDKINIVKPDKMSVGYKTSQENYPFKETVIELEEDMKFYLTTDGFIDQNGGEKDFPFGKKRFKKLIEEYHNLPFEIQKDKFLEAIEKWTSHEQTDDITVIGFKPC